MDQLAGSPEYNWVNFVTISCAGPQLALAFAERLKLRYVQNTVAIENPTWGQLGCSGFIVLDKDANVIVEKTIPFLEYRESAFQYVVDLLDAIKTSGSSEKSDDTALESYVAALPSIENSGESGCGSSSGG